MAQEAFKITRTWVETERKHRSYSSAVCGACGAIDNVPITTNSPLPPEVIVKKMQSRGWVMGQRRKDDLCPKCANRKASEKKVTNIADHTPKRLSEAPAPASREAKRLVILALEDHYLDTRQGYEGGWSDERIAKDLNVPRKLVSDIREEFYGPELDAEVVKLREDLKGIEAQLAAMQTTLSDLRTRHNDVKERLSKKGLL